MKQAPLVVLFVLIIAALRVESAGAQNACATAAFADYNRANVALMQANIPLMSVESIIAQRRLQEQYCLQFALCTIGDPANQSLRIPYSAAFSSCLRDVATLK